MKLLTFDVILSLVVALFWGAIALVVAGPIFALIVVLALWLIGVCFLMSLQGGSAGAY